MVVHGDSPRAHEDSSHSGHSTRSDISRKPPRISLACSRCKRRKQRCDGTHPSCGNCSKASAQCVYERTLRPQYPGGKTLYIRALEERIAFLEARLPEHGQDHLVSDFEHRQPPATGPREHGGRRESCTSLDSANNTENTEEEESSSLVDGVAYLSLCASGATGTAPEPLYLGSSSGAAIARLLQASIYKRSKMATIHPSHYIGKNSAEVPEGASLSPSDDGDHNVLMDDFTTGYSGVAISRQHAESLFSVYFNTLQIRWPILDRELYSKLFELQWDSLAALSPTHRSILHLIYAISARFVQLTMQSSPVDHERHFAAAIKYLDHILEQNDLATVQFLFLLATYGSRSPYGAGSWSQIRHAMTLCIELGLHRMQKGTPARRKDLEMRRRVFWSCYCLDRMTTMTLGRTFAIADRDINVELPDEGPEFWALMSANRPEEGKQHWPNVSQFAHGVRLRQLQSRVFRIVWRVDTDIAGKMKPDERNRLDQKVTHLKGLLDQWMRNAPVAAGKSQDQAWVREPRVAFQDSRDYFLLQYNKTVLSLYSALLPILPPEDPRFLYATNSAAAVCVAYRSLNAQKTLTYTIIALHDCFIAGLTLIYCLWRNPSLFDFDALEATRACSLCLTIFGEKWPGAVKYRDIFDAASGSLLRTIVGGGNSHPSKSSTDRGHTSTLPMDVPIPPPPYAMAPILEANNEVTMSDGFDGSRPGHVQHYGHAVYEAVRSAFVDCSALDDNAWNGWRSFNEVVQSDMAMAPATMWTNAGDGGSDSFSFV